MLNELENIQEIIPHTQEFEIVTAQGRKFEIIVLENELKKYRAQINQLGECGNDEKILLSLPNQDWDNIQDCLDWALTWINNNFQ